MTRVNVKPQVDLWTLSTRAARSSCLSEGGFFEPGACHRGTSFVMSNSFANQTIAQIELWTRTTTTRCTGAQAPRRR